MDPLRGSRRLRSTYVKALGPTFLFSIPTSWGVGKDVKVIKSGYKATGGAVLLVLLAISWLTGNTDSLPYSALLQGKTACAENNSTPSKGAN